MKDIDKQREEIKSMKINTNQRRDCDYHVEERVSEEDWTRAWILAL